jgi:GT2 family glycosyltransferase
MKIDVSICIVNYKADEELKRCLGSIKKFTKGVSYEIILIDNSADNRWYSGGNNLAAGRAKGRYVLFLNPDCWLTNDAVSELADFMDKHPRVGAAEPRQTYENGEIAPTGSLLPKWWIDAVEMTGLSGLFGRLGRLGKFGELDRYRQVEFGRKQNWETEVVSGAAMMVRKEIWDKIGGFDERLKLYYTDVDLCRRIREIGDIGEIWHVGEVEVRHKTRASTSKLPWDRVNLIYAGDAREYYRKWGEKIGGEILYWAMRGNAMVIKIIKGIKWR